MRLTNSGNSDYVEDVRAQGRKRPANSFMDCVRGEPVFTESEVQDDADLHGRETQHRLVQQANRFSPREVTPAARGKVAATVAAPAYTVGVKIVEGAFTGVGEHTLTQDATFEPGKQALHGG